MLEKKAKNVFGSAASTSPGSIFGSIPDSTPDSKTPIDEILDVVGYMKNIDLASELAIKTLKEHVTEEDYNDIDSSLKTEEMKLSQSANELIKAIGTIKRPALHAP